MRTDNRNIYFRTVSQATLFEHEISGQISDGAWENSGPHDHWQFWCNLNVKVDPSNPRVESNEWCRRNTYGINRKDLLEIVGMRMLSMGVIANYLGEIPDRDIAECLEDMYEWNYNTNRVERKSVDFLGAIDKVLADWARYSKGTPDDYWFKKSQKVIEFRNRIASDVDKFFNCIMSYDYKAMLKDLREMKDVMKSVRKW
jgi:hypothetical protein